MVAATYCVAVRTFPSEEIESIRVPCKDPKLGLTFQKFPILHPHRVLWFLFDKIGVSIAAEDVAAYWQHFWDVGEPWATCSPASAQHMPVGLHGDGARLLTHVRFEKHIGVWMNLPLWRPRSIRYSRWLLFSIPRDKIFRNRTLNAVWRRLKWSFDACFQGLNPTVDQLGRALTGKDLQRAGSPITSQGLIFTVTEYRGDWEWHRDTFRPSASWTAVSICFKCPAKVRAQPHSLLAYNWGSCLEDNCGWIRQEYDRDEFLVLRLKNRNLCNRSALDCFPKEFFDFTITP